MFLSKPCSLALPPDSPLRAEDPHYEGIKRVMLTLLLFYSKQSKSIRGANAVYHRITSHVDKPDIYEGIPLCLLVNLLLLHLCSAFHYHLVFGVCFLSVYFCFALTLNLHTLVLITYSDKIPLVIHVFRHDWY